MLNSSVIWTAFALYMVFLLSVAIYVTMKEKKEKNTGSMLKASIPWFVLVMTYISSLMSTWVFFAGPGAYYRNGLFYWVSELSYIALFPIVTHFTMNKVWVLNQEYNGKFITPSDFYFERFKSPLLRSILGFVFLGASLPYVASVLVAIAQSASYATGGAIDYKIAVIVIGLIMTIFVCIGGVKSTAMADTVQGVVFISLLWVIAISCLIVGFNGSLTNVVEKIWNNSNSFFSYPGSSNAITYATRLGYPLSCAIGWTIMLPHVFVRSGYYGDNLKAQRKLSKITPILQVLIWTGTMIIGAIGLGLNSNLGSSETELIIPYMIQNFIISYSPLLAKGLMVGFFVGSTAVGISTACAFLSVSSGIVSSDIIKNTLNITIKERNQKNVDRIIIAAIGIISIMLAINPPDLIFTLIMFSIAIVMPLFPILIMAIYWKKATKQAAILSSILGVIVVLCTYFVWDLGNTWYGSIGMLVSTVVMIVVSKMTKQNEEDSKEFYDKLEAGMARFYDIAE
ncbi:sodium:solute symporter family protein [Allofustis seminis]|uniref:sodium:solute symporter family protein n=1 Tax=Allofustis seminis TaxID=166939 RepID=UPI00036DA4AE|nr:sodium:solute symporter family protein [Allofustis seminis]